MTTLRRKLAPLVVAIVSGGAVAVAQDVTPNAKGGGGNKYGNSDCAFFCDLQFGDGTTAAQSCIKDATKKTGLCYQCGPKAPPSSTLTACSGTCVDLKTSASHCGSCTTACSSGQTCSSGTCTGGGGGTECGRFDGTNGGTWETKAAPPGFSGGFSDYTPSGQTGLYYYNADGNAFEYYDITADAWSNKATAPLDYDYYAGLAWVGGTLYAISGNDVYAYSIASDSWSTLLSTVTTTTQSLATGDGAGHVYAVAFDNTLVRYDIAGNTVTYPATIPLPIYEPRVAFDACSGKVFVARRFDYGDLYAIDPASSYAVTTLAPQPEDYVNDIFCSDRSGHLYSGGNPYYSTTFWKYDIATDTWSRMPDLPAFKGNNGGCSVGNDGYLYVYNGEGAPMMRIKLN